jgi:hypothetical protein
VDQRAPLPVQPPVPVPVPRPALQRITEFVKSVIRTGENVEAAAEQFLRQNPDLINVLIGAAVAALAAMIVQDILTAGGAAADNPLIISICFRIIQVARAIKAGAAAATL